MGSPFDPRHIRVASPCSEDWTQMSGDDRVRHCAKCRLNVYDFSQLSVKEIEALVTRTEGRLCGRIHRRKDGTMLTRDCPVGLAKVRRRAAAALAATVALVGGVFGTLYALRPRAEVPADGTGSAELWGRVETQAIELKEKAREVPVVGRLIEWIDPTPVYPHVLGGLIISTPPGALPGGALQDVLMPEEST